MYRKLQKNSCELHDSSQPLLLWSLNKRVEINAGNDLEASRHHIRVGLHITGHDHKCKIYLFGYEYDYAYIGIFAVGRYVQTLELYMHTFLTLSHLIFSVNFLSLRYILGSGVMGSNNCVRSSHSLPKYDMV